jgi:tetratricopeptide (TPR) repeat protein
MMIRLIFVFLASCGFSNLGCMQHYGTSVDGIWTQVNSSYGVHAFRRMTELPTTDWQSEANRLAALVTGANPNYQDVSNYAEALAHLGRVKEAIQFLEPLAQKMPGEYAVIANLGTAYELDGQNEKALKYISDGIKINPHSHEETEWLHVKILEAKIQMAKDPTWIKSHSVSGYKFGNGNRPVWPVEFTKENRAESWVADAITYQLHERLQFVKAPDVIVADLLCDLGNIFALRSTIEDGLPFYDLALKFNAGAKPSIDARVMGMKQMANGWSVGKFARKYPWAAGVMVVFAGGGLIAFTTVNRKRRESGAGAPQSKTLREGC